MAVAQHAHDPADALHFGHLRRHHAHGANLQSASNEESNQFLQYVPSD
jgi:hypothetical protein